jgi:hypothetical protein
MARGWESKSIESQIETAEDRKALKKAAILSEEQLRVERERDSLELSRTRVLHDLETATHARYRQQLQSALKHLEERLTALR